MKKTLFYLGPVLISLSALQSQAQSSLWVQPKGISPKEYDFDSFRNITFKDGQLQVVHLNGTVEAFGLRQTQKLFFTKMGDPNGLFSGEIASFPTKIFPNPISGNQVTLHYHLTASGPVSISLVGMDGSTRRETSTQGQTGQNVFHWDVKDLPSGVYLYQVKAGDKIATGKLIN